MKYSILTFLIIYFPLFLQGQNFINSGATIKITAGTDMKVNANVLNKNGGNTNNEGNLYLKEDFVQTGATTVYSGNGWLWFEGSTNQNISSESNLSIAKIKLNNGQKLMLGNDIRISNTLDLNNNGNIELGDYNLILEVGVSINNYDNNNYIITNGTGTLQQIVETSDVVFPVGNTTYNPAILNNVGVSDNFSIRVEDEVLESYPSGTVLTNNVVDRVWIIEEETEGNSDVTLVLQWDESQELSFDRTLSGIAHWVGNTWEQASIYTNATNLSGSTWTQSRANITSFSPFAIEDSNEPLPIELLDFQAKRLNEKKVILTWQTTLEKDNAGFEIQMNADGQNFKKVGFVEGQGNSSEIINYEFLVINSNAGYYRLKQIDFDNSFSYSPIRFVEGVETQLNLKVYPNPTQGEITIDLENYTEEAILKVSDMRGQILLNTQNNIVEINQQLNQNLKHWSNGVYVLTLMIEDKIFIHKIILDR